MKSVSVIVPVYNSEKYLEECVDSILSQNYDALELLLVDDGSTDTSGKICDEYSLKDHRVKTFHINNAGPSRARNYGLDQIKGELVMFVDSDDILIPGAISVLSNIISRYDVDIAEGKHITGKHFKPKLFTHSSSPKIYTRTIALQHLLYQKHLTSSTCGKLFKKEIFSELRFREGTYYEDLDISYKLIDQSEKIAFIDTPVYFYRKTAESRINKWHKGRLDVLRVTEDMETYFNLNHPEIISCAKDRRLSANFNMFCLASMNNEIEEAEKCWNLIKNYRNASLLNKQVRIKNKAGILLSYGGRKLVSFLGKLIYSH